MNSYILKVKDEQGNWIDIPAIKGSQGEAGVDGQDGADGFSPIANVTQSDDITTITITDKDGTTEESIDLSDKQSIEDNTLTTTDKTIVGAINEINANKYDSSNPNNYIDNSVNDLVNYKNNTVLEPILNGKADINFSNITNTAFDVIAKKALGAIHYDSSDFSKIGALWYVHDLQTGSVSLPANGFWWGWIYKYNASGIAGQIGSVLQSGIWTGGTTFTVGGEYPHYYISAIRIKE